MNNSCTWRKTPRAELDDSPEYPSGLDPELREGINIVQDMLKLESSGK